MGRWGPFIVGLFSPYRISPFASVGATRIEAQRFGSKKSVRRRWQPRGASSFLPRISESRDLWGIYICLFPDRANSPSVSSRTGTPERARFLRGILLRLVAIYLSVYVIFLSNRERKISAGVSGRLEWSSGVCSSVDV
jgi:hypothetical protein